MSIPVGCLRHGAKVNYIKNFARPPGSPFQQRHANSYRGLPFCRCCRFQLQISSATFLSPRARTANYAISLLSADVFQFSGISPCDQYASINIYRFFSHLQARFSFISHRESVRSNSVLRNFFFSFPLPLRREELAINLSPPTSYRSLNFYTGIKVIVTINIYSNYMHARY